MPIGLHLGSATRRSPHFGLPALVDGGAVASVDQLQELPDGLLFHDGVTQGETGSGSAPAPRPVLLQPQITLSSLRPADEGTGALG
jgi:hypothetical protein